MTDPDAQHPCHRQPSEDKLLKPCHMSDLSSPDPSLDFDYSQCPERMHLRPEDEISIGSIISALLSTVEPTEVAFANMKWGLTGKEMRNDKQSMLFQENLYISKLKDTKCKLAEVNKIFLEHELEHIGCFCLSIEESYDGYVVFSKSKMRKGSGQQFCGHTLKGKYDDRFLLICEKRMEFDYVDKVRVEKCLEARKKEDTLVCIRETRINKESQKLKADINIKGREKDPLILDGGVMLLIRYKVMNHQIGKFCYYTLNIAGRVIECCFDILPERKRIKVFNTTHDNAVHVVCTQTFNGATEEVSESYYSGEGRLLLHFWHHYNYILHVTKRPAKPPEKILPKLELMWRSDNLLLQKYKKEKKLNYENAIKYLTNTPELADFLYDYIICLLRFKPPNVLEFTVRYFQNMKTNY